VTRADWWSIGAVRVLRWVGSGWWLGVLRWIGSEWWLGVLRSTGSEWWLGVLRSTGSEWWLGVLRSTGSEWWLGVTGHAVNPSMGACVRHPCLTQSRNPQPPPRAWLGCFPDSGSHSGCTALAYHHATSAGSEASPAARHWSVAAPHFAAGSEASRQGLVPQPGPACRPAGATVKGAERRGLRRVWRHMDVPESPAAQDARRGGARSGLRSEGSRRPPGPGRPSRTASGAALRSTRTRNTEHGTRTSINRINQQRKDSTHEHSH
jgi:hypothetical protein